MAYNYTRLDSIETFGATLIKSGDLDPLYIALLGAKLQPDQLASWLFAYWCFYHAGVASFLSERLGPEYWYWFEVAARNEAKLPGGLEGRWPRGHERRHFRGDKAIQATHVYKTVWRSPQDIVTRLVQAGPKFRDVRFQAQLLPQFGPWIAFKVADMLERVANVRVDFDAADVMLYDQPYKSALHVWETREIGSSIARASVTSNAEKVARVAKWLGMVFSETVAPPYRLDGSDRIVNIQEVETILCKWKSHLGGSYPVGIDSRELVHGLEEWSQVSTTAGKLLASAPRVA